MPSNRPLKPLKGVRILSLSLNLPGPAALARCRDMGARCVKLEPPAAPGATRGDPMHSYCAAAYDALHVGIRTLTVDLKREVGQARLHRELARTDLLLTSFRPSALKRLGLGWNELHRRYPALSQVAIVGARAEAAELPGHDLTYQAENGLLDGLNLPPTLFADMGGALLASEAVLQAVLLQRQDGAGRFVEVALSDAAAYLAQPLHWGATLPGTLLRGAHAGYRVYRCLDGRVALAALEPHFAQRLCHAAEIAWRGPATMSSAVTRRRIAGFLAALSCAQVDALARAQDIPLHVLPD